MMLSVHVESIILLASPAESMMLSLHAESTILSVLPAERSYDALSLRARLRADSQGTLASERCCSGQR
jgi:hypothetical protein